MKTLLLLLIMGSSSVYASYDNPYNTTHKMSPSCYSVAQSGTEEFNYFITNYMPICMAYADMDMQRKIKDFKEFGKSSNMVACVTPKTIGDQMFCRQLYATYMQAYMQYKVMNTPLKGK